MPAMNPPKSITEAARLKIDRAKHHISELAGEVNAFLVEKPFKLVRRTDPKAAERVLIVKANKPIPPRFSLIVGDAVHNLRSALDITIFNLIADKVADPSNVQFPFCKSAEAMSSAIAGRQIQVAGEKVVDAIKALKPYPGGNDHLWGLHVLDLTDKHKLILTTGSAASLSGNDLSRAEPGLNIIGDGVVKFAGSDRLASVGIKFMNRRARRAAQRDPAVEEETKVQPAFEICFGSGEPFAGQNVVEQLMRLSNAVVGAIGDVVDAANATPKP